MEKQDHLPHRREQFRESRILQEWYAANRRDLPWRNTRDPYLVWISEIILQQTRVAQGLDYYIRFTGRFPDVRSLAAADRKETLKYWQGLGYYSRARNLHEAAKDIQSRFGGVFPEQYDDILSLKGIGEYTAAAIASFVWNQPRPVIDGNVYRVLGRLFGVATPVDTGKGKKEYRELAALLMPPGQARPHNQAIMEFGALQCVPQNPDCSRCPLSAGCLAHASGNPQQYPVKQNRTKSRNRYLHYFFITCGSHTYLHHRTEKDIWQGLYEFPLIETDAPANPETDGAPANPETDGAPADPETDGAPADPETDGAPANPETDGAPADFLRHLDDLFRDAGQPAISVEMRNIKHILSHQTLYATFYRAEIQKENVALKKYLKIPLSALDEYPFPKLISAFLSREEKTAGHVTDGKPA
ncbi:MAG: A/G-specific adenine glycosylase [Tannerella sp.]|jgi:A/G-specific adenine glycosylase|nr:A/G-specific adenine glycosylase [Tannerella sp.]